MTSCRSAASKAGRLQRHVSSRHQNLHHVAESTRIPGLSDDIDIHRAVRPSDGNVWLGGTLSAVDRAIISSGRGAALNPNLS